LPFGVSPLVNCSDAELKLLLPEHRVEINSGKGANLLLMLMLVVMLVVVVAVVTLPMSMANGVRDIRLSKKTARGSDDRCMLLPLNP
jgi:hypothetical protein